MPFPEWAGAPSYTPNGIRTRVTALKGRGPRPLADGGPARRITAGGGFLPAAPGSAGHSRHAVESVHDGARSGSGRADPRLARLADRRRRRARVRVHARRLAGAGADRGPLLRAAGRARGAGGALRLRRVRLRRRARGAVLRASLRLGGRRPHQAVGPRRRARGGLAGGARLPGVRSTCRASSSQDAADDVAAHLARSLRRAGATSSTSCAACCATRIWRPVQRRATCRCRACRGGSPGACDLSRSLERDPGPAAAGDRAGSAAVRPGRAPAPARSAGGAEGASSGSGAGTGSSTGSTTITRCGSPISTSRC